MRAAALMTTSTSSRPLRESFALSKTSSSPSQARTGGGWCGCAMPDSTLPLSGVNELERRQSNRRPFEPANANKRLRRRGRRPMHNGVKKLGLRARQQTTWRKRRAVRPPQRLDLGAPPSTLSSPQWMTTAAAIRIGHSNHRRQLPLPPLHQPRRPSCALEATSLYPRLFEAASIAFRRDATAHVGAP